MSSITTIAMPHRYASFGSQPPQAATVSTTTRREMQASPGSTQQTLQKGSDPASSPPIPPLPMKDMT